MNIKELIGSKLRKLALDSLPLPVVDKIEQDVAQWERELHEDADKQVVAMIEKRITKPFVSRTFNTVVNPRKVKSHQGDF